MKLELKHYLDTKLIMKSPQGFRPNGKESTGVLGIVYLTADLYADIQNNTFNGEEFIPILRPLSDLTKEIEVNGEKFVPSQEYNYLRIEEISTFKGGCNALNFIQVREQNLLLELHFDIFGLIEKGLAIDINTLKK